MIKIKQVPKWVQARESLNGTAQPPVEFVGEMGVDAVVDGKLPNGELYTWFKRKNTKSTSYKARRK